HAPRVADFSDEHNVSGRARLGPRHQAARHRRTAAAEKARSLSRKSKSRKSASRRLIDVYRPEVVHRVGGTQGEASIAELAVDGQLVVLVARIGDPVDREDAAPALPV